MSRRQKRPRWTEAEKDERKAEYHRYLASRLWQAIRGAAIHRAGGVCEWCRGSDRLQVHHLKYPRVFGTETPEMLKVLCDLCHGEAHGRPYILCRPSRVERKARHLRLKGIAREKREARKKLRAIAKRKYLPPPPSASFKDRFGEKPTAVRNRRTG